MIIKYFKDYIFAINEGLIKTYPGYKVCKEINRSLFDMDINANCVLFDDIISLDINQINGVDLNRINLLFDHILSFVVNRGGWFPFKVTYIKHDGISNSYKYDLYEIISNYKDYSSITIFFEKKFPDSDSDVPDKLYHLSIKEYYNKIKKYGLSPKSKSKLTSHIDRIYVCKSVGDCENLIPKMLLYYSNEKDQNIYKHNKKLFKKDITPIIYEIDNSSGFIDKLYKDINYESGYFVLDNIDKNYIKKYGY